MQLNFCFLLFLLLFIHLGAYRIYMVLVVYLFPSLFLRVGSPATVKRRCWISMTLICSWLLMRCKSSHWITVILFLCLTVANNVIKPASDIGCSLFQYRDWFSCSLRSLYTSIKYFSRRLLKLLFNCCSLYAFIDLFWRWLLPQIRTICWSHRFILILNSSCHLICNWSSWSDVSSTQSSLSLLWLFIKVIWILVASVTLNYFGLLEVHFVYLISLVLIH